MFQRITLMLVAIGMVGCAAGANTADDGDLLAIEEGPRTDITMLVQNQNYYDAELYLRDESNHLQRLGFVSGNANQTFTFKWPESRRLHVEIHLISVGTYESEDLSVQQGDDLELIIEPELHLKRPVRLRPRG